MNDRLRQQIRAARMTHSRWNQILIGGRLFYLNEERQIITLQDPEAVSETVIPDGAKPWHRMARADAAMNLEFTTAYPASDMDEETEERIMARHIPCEGCRHDLGGGHCRIGLEMECREGGGYEAFEPKPEPEPEKPGRMETAVKWAAVILLAMAYPVVAYGVYQLAHALLK